MKKVVILASGTRGDIQPYAALGQGLRAAGFNVVVATHLGFRSLIEKSQLAFALLDGNPTDLMMQPNAELPMVYDGNVWRNLRATVRFVRAARPIYWRMLHSAWQACADANAVVLGMPTTWGAHIAEALGAPCVWCFLQPFTRTRAWPSALVPSSFSLGGWYNALTHRFVEQAIWQPWRGLINQFRRTVLGLKNSPMAGVYSPETPLLYGFSPYMVPRPADWPQHHVALGYWFLDEERDWVAPYALAQFLDGRARVVYVGFGSPGVRRGVVMLGLVEQALHATGLRAVLALPPHLAQHMPASPNILVVDDVPHAWLFARVAGVVHHGGAGTTGAAARAGVPQVVLPLAVDQYFWGERVRALGLGPRPIPQRSLTAQGLAQALQQTVYDTRMRAVASMLGEQIAGEDGVRTAVEKIRTAL
jgi:sterol 3beta-glucosyltransferase